jgi:membrane protease YdiL (CAAX protease family)/uncharacterized protein YgiM (DUF1202 family)
MLTDWRLHVKNVRNLSTLRPDPHLTALATAQRWSALASNPFAIAEAYLAVLAVAEVVTNLIAPEIGLALFGIILITLIIHATLSQASSYYKLLLALTFVPLIRILSLSLPLAGLPIVDWYFVISVPIFVAAYLSKRALGFSWREIGLNPGRLRLQAPVALTGLVLGWVEYQILQPDPLVQNLTLTQLWVPVAILLVSTGFFEELIFRGLMQSAATLAIGRLGILYVAILFTVLHVGWKSSLDMLFVLGVGLYFGWIVWKTRSLLGVTLAHGLNNVVLFLVLPFVPMVSPLAIAANPPEVQVQVIASTPTPSEGAAATLAITPPPVTTIASPSPLATSRVSARPTARATATPSAGLATETPPLAAATPVPSRSVSPAASTSVPTSTPPPPVTAIVNLLSVNVRGGPGIGYQALGAVVEGQNVHIIARDANGQWLEICCLVDGNRSGWVYAGAMKSIGSLAIIPTVHADTPASVEPLAGAVRAIVADDWANVRTGPSTSYQVLTAAPPGLVFDAVGQSQARTWLEVCCVSGRDGWIFRPLLNTTGNVNTLPVK